MLYSSTLGSRVATRKEEEDSKKHALLRFCQRLHLHMRRARRFEESIFKKIKRFEKPNFQKTIWIGLFIFVRRMVLVAVDPACGVTLTRDTDSEEREREREGERVKGGWGGGEREIEREERYVCIERDV